MHEIIKGEALVESLHTIYFGDYPARQLDQVSGDLAIRGSRHASLAGNATRLIELFHDVPPYLYNKVLLLWTLFFICSGKATCQGPALSDFPCLLASSADCMLPAR